jgi:HEAT repeat protein
MRVKRRAAALCLWAVCVFSLFAQESVLQSYERRFTRAALSGKGDVLREAALDERAPEFIGSLYEFALRFALGNAEILGDDPEMMDLVGIAAAGAGSAGFKESLDTLWQLFLNYDDSFAAVEIIGALGILGEGSGEAAERLNRYLDSRRELYRSGASSDYAVMSACIGALARIGDSSSFPVLFAVMISDYPAEISREAAAALDSIPGDYRWFLLNTILKGPPEEKLAAFTAAAAGGRLGPAERGQIAEAALEQSLSYFPAGAGEYAALSEMRYASALALTRLQWTRASALAIRHFYRARADFQQGLVPRERFLEAVACLGAMGSSDAALALGLQLGLLNAQAEKNEDFDENIILAVVRALGSIGDKSAFDYLLSIGYLSYPEHIQAAAKEALSRLRW